MQRRTNIKKAANPAHCCTQSADHRFAPYDLGTKGPDQKDDVFKARVTQLPYTCLFRLSGWLQIMINRNCLVVSTSDTAKNQRIKTIACRARSCTWHCEVRTHRYPRNKSDDDEPCQYLLCCTVQWQGWSCTVPYDYFCWANVVSQVIRHVGKSKGDAGKY